MPGHTRDEHGLPDDPRPRQLEHELSVPPANTPRNPGGSRGAIPHGFEGMATEELVLRARALGVEGCARMSRQELIELLRAP